MNENGILEEDRRESLSSTNQTAETPTQEDMDCEAFQQLLIQERDQTGNLIFEGNTRDSIFDEECSIQGFQIEVYQTSPSIRMHQRDLVVMACNFENFENQGVFITFDHSLIINDTILKGFYVYVGCENNGKKLKSLLIVIIVCFDSCRQPRRFCDGTCLKLLNKFQGQYQQLPISRQSPFQLQFKL